MKKILMLFAIMFAMFITTASANMGSPPTIMCDTLKTFNDTNGKMVKSDALTFANAGGYGKMIHFGGNKPLQTEGQNDGTSLDEVGCALWVKGLTQSVGVNYTKSM